MVNGHDNFTIITMEVIWLIITTVCLPVLIPIAVYVKVVTPRLPEARGKRTGSCGSSTVDIRNLVFIGESPVVGVGVETIDQGVVAKTAKELSRQMNCTVKWRATGINGINISGTINKLITEIKNQEVDYLVICLGVNDTKGFTRFSVWEKEITRLINRIKNNHTCKIFFLTIPDISSFTALPDPLGFLLGYRARILNLITLNHPYSRQKYHFIPQDVTIEPDYLAEDGFHPSAKGCTEMGKTISRFITSTVNHRQPEH